MNETRDWGGYKALSEEARKDAKKYRESPLVDCPVCGEPLEFRNGIAHCPRGDFRSSATTKGTIW